MFFGCINEDLFVLSKHVLDFIYNENICIFI